MKSYHDYHLTGYRVDGEAKSVTFELAWSYPDDPNPRPEEVLVFTKVEGYLLEHDLGVSIVNAFEEADLEDSVRSLAGRFENSAKWGWLAFWRENIGGTLKHLRNIGARFYQLIPSYGLCGWLVCRDEPKCEPRQ